jgi:hypothetical protein
MVVGWIAGDVGVDVTLELEAPSHAGVDEALQGTEYRRPPQRRRHCADLFVDLGRRQLAPGTPKCIGHDQALTGDAFAGGAQSLSGCVWHAGTVSQSRPRIMWR